ncbi:MAG: DUF503 domain-containing protein, partial [Desulfobacterales bacterium]|nr:DUF503 domain-containing protein [Desulfobacterales bacterium]MDX2508680.1 DUF503 domain-containing protein [Desulfobacterales bacterium]
QSNQHSRLYKLIALITHICSTCERLQSEACATLLFRMDVYGACAMIVGIGIITFRLHDCRSLKGKRKIIKSIISRLQNKFNASVAEIGFNDIYQKSQIGFSMVGNNRKLVNSKIDKIFNMADELGLAEIIDTEMEIININSS